MTTRDEAAPKRKRSGPPVFDRTIPPERRVTLTEATFTEGALVAVRPRRTYRFLLSSGDTVDVITDRDDSDLRAAIVERFGVERIEGVVIVGDGEP